MTFQLETHDLNLTKETDFRYAVQSLFEWIVSENTNAHSSFINWPKIIGNPCSQSNSIQCDNSVNPETSTSPISLKRKLVLSVADSLAPTVVKAVSALVVSRFLASEGSYHKARDYIRRSREHIGENRIFEYALYAIERTEFGERIPRALLEHVGIQDNYLATHTCDQPYKNFYITSDGGVLSCCGVFLPQHIGNVFYNDGKEILNSSVAQDIRKSVQDGTFSYCDHIKCPIINNDRLQPINQQTDKYDINHPEKVMFGIDLTCNLACPQCRQGMIAERSTEMQQKYDNAMRTVLPLLESSKRLVINPSGEVFASKVSRKLLSLLNKDKYPDLKIDLMTNGVLFTPDQWDNFSNIHDMIGFVRVSIDAATASTWEVIRGGHNFETLKQNLCLIKSLREKGIIEQFEMLFVYQSQNFREMPAFVQWAKELSCDKVIFQQLFYLPGSGYTFENVLERSVFKSEHPLHKEFITILESMSPDFDQITIDVDYGVGIDTEYYSSLLL